jgi:hypothetical protein
MIYGVAETTAVQLEQHQPAAALLLHRTPAQLRLAKPRRSLNGRQVVIEECAMDESKLLEHLPDALLVVATFFLAWATYRLWEATKLLADSATRDSRERKIIATTDAWMQIRPTLELRHLTAEDKLSKEERSQLSTLEAYAGCVNSDAYDLATFNRISGAWFIHHYRWIEPYIVKQREQTTSPPYQELINLNESIKKLRVSTAPAAT